MYERRFCTLGQKDKSSYTERKVAVADPLENRDGGFRAGETCRVPSLRVFPEDLLCPTSFSPERGVTRVLLKECLQEFLLS